MPPLYWDVLGGELSPEPLTAGVWGDLVVATVILWLRLAVVVEVTTRRIRVGLDEAKLREPAHDSLSLYRAATAVAVVLPVVVGLLSAGVGS